MSEFPVIVLGFLLIGFCYWINVIRLLDLEFWVWIWSLQIDLLGSPVLWRIEGSGFSPRFLFDIFDIVI